MIVLRITIDGRSREIRSGKAEILLGSGAAADVRAQGGGWAKRAARLHHRGTEVFVEPLDGTPARALRLGDEVLLGTARVELVGLLPLAGGAAPDVPVFGGYEVEDASSRTFTLADEAAPVVGTTTTSHTFPPQDHRSPPSSKPKKKAAAPPKAKQRPVERDALSTRPAHSSTKARAAAGAAAGTTARTKPPTTRPSTGATQKKQAKTSSSAPTKTVPETAAEAERARVARMLRGSDDFASELYATIRKSPFYAVSIAMHFLVFVIIALIDTKDEFVGNRDLPSLQVSEIAADDDPAFDPSEDPMDEAPEAESELEIPDMEPDALDDHSPQPDNKPTERSDAPDLAELPEPEIQPVDVGLAPRHTSFRNRTRTKKPNVSKDDLERKIVKGGAADLNNRSAGLVRGALGLGPGGGNNGRMPRPTEMLVVDGAFDSISDVLDALKLKHVRADPLEVVRGRKYKLSKYKIIWWNCGEGLPEVWMAKFRPKLKRWIEQGGYFFSTDWAIATVVAPMFSDLVKTSGQRKPIREMVLHIKPTEAEKNHPLLRGVFMRQAKGQWWLEQASFDIQVQDKEEVKVLIEAPQLRDVFQRSPVVAVTFDHGRGRVLHVMGHYFQKMGNLAGTIAAHRMALNFVMDRVKRTR